MLNYHLYCQTLLNFCKVRSHFVQTFPVYILVTLLDTSYFCLSKLIHTWIGSSLVGSTPSAMKLPLEPGIHAFSTQGCCQQLATFWQHLVEITLNLKKQNRCFFFRAAMPFQHLPGHGWSGGSKSCPFGINLLGKYTHLPQHGGEKW